MIAFAIILVGAAAGDETERRALGYLSREVPRWSAENRCYSCHNNADAARALFAAIGLVDVGVLADTEGWLARPERWDSNGGEGPFNDRRLARIQFASALASAVAAGRVGDRGPLVRAARRLVEDQANDGSWPIDDGGRVGSPAAYGRALATYSARETLRAAGPDEFREPIERAGRWLKEIDIKTIVDATVVILASTSEEIGTEPRRRAIDMLRRGQSSDGGWGPFVSAPPEVFDTALSLLALDRIERPGVAEMVRRGRAFLIAEQADDGSWTETTRPSGGVSYAQRVSTTAWATLALIATRPTINAPGTEPSRSRPRPDP